MTPVNKSDYSGIHFTRIMSRVDDPLRRNRECDVYVLRKSFSRNPNMNDIQLSSKHIIDENITCPRQVFGTYLKNVIKKHMDRGVQLIV